MEREIKARLGWVQLYFEMNDTSFVCKHCGVEANFEEVGEALFREGSFRIK